LTGSKTWPATAWRRLLEAALPVLDEAGAGTQWTLGGGTALALRLEHRISYDIDIFLESSAVLRAASPNRNAAARALTSHWQEPGHYVKLECENGAIDFIVASRQTDVSPWRYDFKDRAVLVETPAEILAKKLRYRGSQLVPRDIFDLLVAARFDPAAVATAVQAVPRAARLAVDRIERISRRYRDTIADEVNPTTKGAELLEIDPLHAAAVLRELLERAVWSEDG
jgi:hypothetical protein